MRIEKLFFHVPYKVLMENTDFISRNLINCEIFFDSTALDACSKEDASLINFTFKKHGLSKTIHGPFMDLNLGSLDSIIREATYDRYDKTLELCRSLNVNIAVFHSSFFPVYYDSYLKRWLEHATEGWLKLLDKARAYGITLMIENSIDKTPRAILELLKRINDKSFKACLDFGHYYIFGEKNGLEHIRQYPKDSIGEVHISDSNGRIDQHLALGKGSLPIRSFFDALDELSIKPVITVEPHCIEDILVSREYLKANGLI
jgi:sugar phosphate isomerase/epimerase